MLYLLNVNICLSLAPRHSSLPLRLSISFSFATSRLLTSLLLFGIELKTNLVCYCVIALTAERRVFRRHHHFD